MSKPAISLHFGIELQSTEDHFRIYDDSAAVWLTYRLPAGKYYYNHPESSKNIVDVINVLAYGYLTLTRSNDRQLLFDMTAAADDFQLIETTTNRDSEKLAEMLGLYDNSGNLEYNYSVNVTDGWISQVTLCSWYSAGGRMFETSTERGFKSYLAQYSGAQNGKTAGISTGARNIIKNLQLTSIDVDDLRIIDEFTTQSTLGTTLNADSTTSFWRAYNPELHLSSFYTEFTNTSGAVVKGEWHITDPIEPENCKPTVPGWSGLFDLALSASFVETPERTKFLYFPTGVNCSCQATSPLFDFTGDLTVIFKFYHISHVTDSTLITNGLISPLGTGFRLIFRGTTNFITYIQVNPSGSYNAFATTLEAPPNEQTDIILTRQGGTGTNNLKILVNSVESVYSTTVIPPAIPYLSLMQYYGLTSSSTYGYLIYAQIINRVITAEEKTLAKLGVYPTDGFIYPLNELGGYGHLDHGPNGVNLTSSGTTWAVIP